MCSTDYEMLVSHSPPVFSHSPPTGSFLTEYAALRLGADTFPRSVTRNSCRPIHHSNSWNTFLSKPIKKLPNSPARPCLVIRTPEDSIQVDEDPSSPTKLKKKVVFADDKGMSLTHIRIMTEPSNVPPLWSYRFLSEVTQGLSADPVGDENPWEITFPQPASDYISFRKRLDNEKVSLENVIIKDSEEIMQGTIKVRNETYDKEVFLRSSTNNWKTYEDYYCTFVPNNLNSSFGVAYVLYDTFSFNIPLPPKTNRIEFCVCFKCGSNEYWDNNYQNNYLIVRKFSSTPASLQNGEKDHKNEKFMELKDGPKKYMEITQAKMDSWSEFASWNHLENTNPYW